MGETSLLAHMDDVTGSCDVISERDYSELSKYAVKRIDNLQLAVPRPSTVSD